jgi:hypothetical protein
VTITSAARRDPGDAPLLRLEFDEYPAISVRES